MDYARIIYLVTENFSEDAYGVYQKTEHTRKVFAHVQSVTQTEWFEGGRNGLNPEFKFTMFEGDYKGEEILKYRGEYYTIYRTYRTRTKEIELYAQRRQGNVKDNKC